jgi:hypothetical protein
MDFQKLLKNEMGNHLVLSKLKPGGNVRGVSSTSNNRSFSDPPVQSNPSRVE